MGTNWIEELYKVVIFFSILALGAQAGVGEWIAAGPNSVWLRAVPCLIIAIALSNRLGKLR